MFGPRLLRSALITVFGIALAGCPESTPVDIVDVDPSRPTDPDPLPPPPPPVARVPHGTPVVYIATSSDASVYNHEIGDVIEGSRGAFVQIDPAAQDAVLFHTTSSTSYARSRTTLYTFDDEIYLLDVGETGARVRRLDKEDLRSGSDTPVPTPRSLDSVEDGCFVVQGDDLVYKVAYRQASFPGTGWADGPLVRVPNFFNGGVDVVELLPGLGGDSSSPGGFVTAACQFHMDWADGVWYDVSDRPENDALTIFERDPATGEPTPVGFMGNVGQIQSEYSITNLGFDRGLAYFALLDVDLQEIGIVARSVSGGLWQVVMTRALDGFQATDLHSLDVDDGHIAFVMRGADGDAVALYSAQEDDFQSVAVGTSINQLQVLYR